MSFGSRELLRRPSARDLNRSQGGASPPARRRDGDGELDSTAAIHETAAQMLDRMAVALERKNVVARQNLAGGLNDVR